MGRKSHRDSAHLDLLGRLAEQTGDKQLALNILRKRGHVHQDSEELTKEGKERDSMGAEGRAMDRAVTNGGGTIFDYTYDYDTNRTKRR